MAEAEDPIVEEPVVEEPPVAQAPQEPKEPKKKNLLNSQPVRLERLPG